MYVKHNSYIVEHLSIHFQAFHSTKNHQGQNVKAMPTFRHWQWHLLSFLLIHINTYLRSKYLNYKLKTTKNPKLYQNGLERLTMELKMYTYLNLVGKPLGQYSLKNFHSQIIFSEKWKRDLRVSIAVVKQYILRQLGKQ